MTTTRMQHIRLTATALMLAIAAIATAQDPNLAYIQQYKDLAIKEMQRVRIPASIKLAQAIIESAGGRSSMCREANNHFGIKCHNTWTGETYYMVDDDRDSLGNLRQSCFRKYRDPYDSWMDHSNFLVNGSRYAELFTYDIFDYRRWAQGLKRAGYATAPNYADMLIERVEKYQLYQYDYEAMGGTNAGPVANGRVGEINDLPVYFADEGQSLSDIARASGKSLRDLRKFNERIMASDNAKLPKGYPVYVKKKKSSFLRQRYHKVQQGETMFSISQKYGIRLNALYAHNRMEKGTQPAVGQNLMLQFSLFGPKNKINTRPSSPTDDTIRPNMQPTNTVPGTVPPLPVPTTPTGTPDGPMTDANKDGVLDMDIIPGGVIAPNAPAPTLPRVPGGNSGGTTTPPSQPNTGGNSGSTRPGGNTTTPPAPTPGMPGADTSVKPNSGGSTSNPTPPPPPVLDGSYHTVVKGDTLYNIAKRYGITVNKLKEMNGLTTDGINLGQKLRVK